jgi:hypothetical protein
MRSCFSSKREIGKPSLARLLARIPNADGLVEHIVASHTTHVDAGRVAKEAKVKNLVLTHFVSVDDPTLMDEAWLEGARTHFDGWIIVGRDLLEIFRLWPNQTRMTF